jgi:hypothetical protein
MMPSVAWKGAILSISCFASGFLAMIRLDAARMPAAISSNGSIHSIGLVPQFVRAMIASCPEC